LRNQLSRPGNSLLVLRAFLGGTFVFAGLQKLANPAFFRPSAPASFESQLKGAIATSPVHGLLRFALHAPTEIAVLIALGEVAAGLGTIFGLFSRGAATGGMLLSLSFFLTVSFHDRPYYYGADIAFLFAWTPFILSEPGPLSLDALVTGRRSAPRSEKAVDVERRNMLGRTGAAFVLGVFGVLLAEVDKAIGYSASNKSSGTPVATTSTTVAQRSGQTSGTRIGLAASIPAGQAVAFTDEEQGIPAYCVHRPSGGFVAFSAICTHAGCTVGFSASRVEFLCPCHGSIYDAVTGAVLQGPAPSPLPQISVRHSGGELFATD
jgi:thiosulfate dehydrogenase [quinone] large subunit